MKAKRNRDVAYACYLWVGIYLVVGAVASFIGTRHITRVGPFEIGDPTAFAFAFFIPLAIPTLIVFLVGIGFSIAARRDRWLWVLHSAMALFIVLAVLSDTGHEAELFALLLPLLMVLLPLRWFFWARRRFSEP